MVSLRKHIAGSLLALPCMIALVGCQPESKQAPPLPKPTPEKKFEVVVTRLKHLIEVTRSPSGLVVQRAVTHRFLPASASNSSTGNGAAETDTSASDAAATPVAVPMGEITVVTQSTIALLPGEEQPSDEEEPSEPAGSVVHRSDSETKQYLLSFREDRWQLDTQPTKESEKLWFEYALEKR